MPAEFSSAPPRAADTAQPRGAGPTLASTQSALPAAPAEHAEPDCSPARLASTDEGGAP